jgi:gliding motility-associated-like protein
MKKFLFFLLLPFFAVGQQLPGVAYVSPQMPVITSGNSTATSVEFFWNAVENASHYKISYEISSGGRMNDIAIGNLRRYTVRGIPPGSSVRFTVTPFDHLGNTLASGSIDYRLLGGDCASSVVPPTTLNGVNITSTSSGSVDLYPSAYSSCGIATTPANSIYLGANGAFSYTMNFSQPVNDLVIVITATGNTIDEIFNFTTNGGIPSISANASCYTTITGNEIASGMNSTFEGGGGGGVFVIHAPANFTSMTITGPGGAAGSLLAVCSNSVTPIECNVSFAPTLSTTSLTATCPITTVNLGAVTTSNLPTTTGVMMTWHTGSPASQANLITGSLTNLPAGPTYYAVFFDSVNDCYGSTTAVTTTTTAITPVFTQVASICSGQNLAPLPTTSNNGIVGTWSPAPNNSTTTAYTFTPTTGCATTASMTIQVTTTVTPAFAAVEPVCFGDVILDLPILSSNGIAGSWSPPLNNSATTTYIFTPNAGQCATTATLEIIIKSKPVVTIENDCVGQAYVLTAVADEAAAIEWYMGDGFQFQVGSQASLTVLTPGFYHVTVVGLNGCETDASFTVDSIACEIQKGISPNGDAFNEYFELTNLNVTNLKIFNRYGMLVYDKTNYTNQWNGKSNEGEQLPDATYYYLIELNGGQSKTGWIYINSKG